MLDRIVYFLASLAVRGIRALPLLVCYRLGQAIGFLLWVVLPGYRRLVRHNLAMAYQGELSAGEIRRLTRRHFMTLGANGISAFKIPAMSPEDVNAVTAVENLDRIKNNVAAGRPVVLAINHIGNWELYAQMVFWCRE